MARSVVNGRINRIRRVFKWAVAVEMVPVAVHQALTAVQGLKRGRSEARETNPIKPVPEEHVTAVKKHVSRQVWALVQLQRLTGMRAGEVVIMRGRDLDMGGKVWLYRPGSYKTQHHGHERIVEIGPKAQAVIKPFLKADIEAYLFSPRDAEAERRAKQHANPDSPGDRQDPHEP